jgi:hypothetical protein
MKGRHGVGYHPRRFFLGIKWLETFPIARAVTANLSL